MPFLMRGIHKAIVINTAYNKLFSSVGNPNLMAIVIIVKYRIAPKATEINQFLNVRLPKMASPTMSPGANYMN